MGLRQMDVHDAPKHMQQSFITLLVLTLTFVSAQAATPSGAETEALISLSLAELLQVTVTSVSRKPQSLTMSPAALFVISQDDSRRSGARTIPDVLRSVPGIPVARGGART